MIFHGIIASTMIPFAWVFLETQKEFPDGPLVSGTPGMVLNAVLVILSAGLIGLSQYLGRKSITKIRQQDQIREKLNVYLSEKIVLYAILESAALLSLVGLYLSKQHVFTVIYLIVLFVFSLQRPSFDRVSRETGVRESDLKKWGEEAEN